MLLDQPGSATLVFFDERTPAAGESDPVGGAILERLGQLLPTPPDGVDVQPGEEGDEPIAAVPELVTLDGGVPAALLLIEPTEQQVHLAMEVLGGMVCGTEAIGALTAMDVLLRH
jgi:hypothetical protein